MTGDAKQEMAAILAHLKDPKSKLDTRKLDELITKGKSLIGDKDNPY